MIEDCFFCNSPDCDICYLARMSCPATTNVGNADASSGLDLDSLFYSRLLGVELSSERERGEAFDPW